MVTIPVFSPNSPGNDGFRFRDPDAVWDNESFPKSYRTNSLKEQTLLSLANNFWRQYTHLYPDRKPLLMCPLNECGLEVRQYLAERVSGARGIPWCTSILCTQWRMSSVILYRSGKMCQYRQFLFNTCSLSHQSGVQLSGLIESTKSSDKWINSVLVSLPLLQKFVCTTLQPTLLPYSDLYNWKECARFVSEFLSMEPMNSPIELVMSCHQISVCFYFVSLTGFQDFSFLHKYQFCTHLSSSSHQPPTFHPFLTSIHPSL